ncbi:hypothetical protein O0L34_g2694 [Tuta absoluta]|nr:hypothetical protein O0L34_g2694 [Tuta absoluta]
MRFGLLNLFILTVLVICYTRAARRNNGYQLKANAISASHGKPKKLATTTVPPPILRVIEEISKKHKFRKGDQTHAHLLRQLMRLYRKTSTTICARCQAKG